MNVSLWDTLTHKRRIVRTTSERGLCKSPTMLIGKSLILPALAVNPHGFSIPPLSSNHLIFQTLRMMTSFLILRLI